MLDSSADIRSRALPRLTGGLGNRIPPHFLSHFLLLWEADEYSRSTEWFRGFTCAPHSISVSELSPLA